MDNSWIKLFRRINNNPIISDANALQVFIWLLINVDKVTGTRSIGRFQLAKTLKMNPNTLKDAIKRLIEKYKMIEKVTFTHDTTSDTTSRHHKVYSTIRLLNWDKYQVQNLLTPQQPISLTPLNKIENKYIIKNTEKSNKKKLLFEKYNLPDPTGYDSIEKYILEKNLTTDQSLTLAEIVTGGLR